MSFCRAFTAVRLPIMGGNSTPEELFNLNDLRVELLQSEARDLLLVCFQQETADASLRSVKVNQPVIPSGARNLLLLLYSHPKSRSLASLCSNSTRVSRLD